MNQARRRATVAVPHTGTPDAEGSSAGDSQRYPWEGPEASGNLPQSGNRPAPIAPRQRMPSVRDTDRMNPLGSTGRRGIPTSYRARRFKIHISHR